MSTVVIVFAFAVIGAFVVFIARANKPWRNVSTADDVGMPSTRSEELYGDAKRPAGPDVGPMDPDRLGGDHRPPSV